jgi:hypothetical protein
MKVPKELEYLATCFYSGSDQEHATTPEWIRATVRDFLLPEERKIVRQFLDELLSGAQTDDDLQRLWQTLDSDYWLKDGAAVRRFLSMIREASG